VRDAAMLARTASRARRPIMYEVLTRPERARPSSARHRYIDSEAEHGLITPSVADSSRIWSGDVDDETVRTRRPARTAPSGCGEQEPDCQRGFLPLGMTSFADRSDREGAHD